MDKFGEFISRGKHEFGDKFDASDLVPKFTYYFNSQERIEVERVYASGNKYVRRGRVGVTSGWKPVFLLMHRRTDRGSSDTLGPNDNVVRIIG